MFAFGRMGLKPWEFYDYLFSDFLIAIKGFINQETEEWKRARLIAWAAKTAFSTTRITPERWLPLPGDKEGGDMTLERAMEFKQRLFDMGILREN